MALLTDRALLLRRTPFGESSLVVQALTRDHGRVHLLAKGAYRATSRFFCALDLFDTLELEWSHSPRRELQPLTRADVAVRRKALPEDLAAFRAGLAMIELVELAARPGQRDPELFERLAAGLDGVSRRARPVDLELVVFELGFLEALGLAPALARCAACGGPAPPTGRGGGGRAPFSAGAGGRLCAACGDEARRSGRRVGTLPVLVLDAAARLAETARRPADAGGGHGPEPGLPEPPIPGPEMLVRVRDFVERFLDYHLETRPKSHRAFLAVPNRNAPERDRPRAAH